MPADGQLRRRLLAPTVLAVLVTAGNAAADAPYGSVQVQYQRSDDAAFFERGDGSFELRRARQEYFIRALDIRQQTYLRTDLMMEASLRISERDVVDSRSFSRVPVGGIRLVHPYLQVTASHQPGWERTALGSAAGFAAGTRADSVAREVNVHSRQSIFAAHLALPRLPRLDVTWVERQRRTDTGPGNRGRTRSARVTLDRDRYSAYASVNQSRFAMDAPGAPATEQTALMGGGSYVFAPRSNVSMRAQYDVSDVLTRSGGDTRPSLVSHTALLDGDWRHGPKWTTNSSLQWRRTATGTAAVRPQSSEEGALTSRYQFARRSQGIGVAGFRSVSVLGAGGPQDGYQKYATAMATIDAPVRRRLGLAATASHTTTWDPDRSPYGVQVLSATTRGNVSRRLSADFNWQISATGDSSAANSRYSNAWALRVQGAPLRSLQGLVAFRAQRSGPGLLRPNSATRGLSAEVRWRPVPRLELFGQYSGTRIEPSQTTNLSTRMLSLRFEPSSAWQYYASWTRSEQRVQVSVAGQLSGREVLTTRVQYAPSRKLAANASLSYNDPGRDEESRRLDTTLVWSFGR